jgi:glycosyltransferase involved in cell wall biosynthesis
MIRISVISPVLNEIDFIGYSIMAMLPHVHEFVYTLDEQSNDGTRELLQHIKDKYAHEKLIVLDHPTFKPLDTPKYNEAYNRCIREATGDAVAFIHPDMIVTKWPEVISPGPLAWWTNLTSYARDFQTIIVKGRTNRWKNIHAKKFGIHYYGGYGSNNEAFYHSDITGTSYRDYGNDYTKYPFEVADSGIHLNHYCELKGYARRLEKMKLCLKMQHPEATDDWIEDKAIHHPRVTLETTTDRFGVFEFKESVEAVPDVFNKYMEEFGSFKKELEPV